MTTLLYGLITGVLFGVLLQRSSVVRYDKQIGALRLKDMTIIKFMLSTILVSMVGIYALKELGYAKLNVKETVVGATVVGGLLFGVGWGLLGYCPGTAAGALGEGRWDALWGILGMLVGAAIFVETYASMKATFLKWGVLGKITLPQILYVNHWLVILAFIIVGLLLILLIEKKGL